jgi:hypothetical protein
MLGSVRGEMGGNEGNVSRNERMTRAEPHDPETKDRTARTEIASS